MDIDKSLVSKLVASQFPQWSELQIEPVEFGGWDNRTFRLGNSMSVRLPSAERYAGKVEKEQRWLPLLAKHLALPIPTPLAMGQPGCGYPWHWSVYEWIEGENATYEGISDLSEFAKSLARFLIALQSIAPTEDARPGPHNFFRGGSPRTYDAETREAIAALDGEIDAGAATAIWDAALSSPWEGQPVWIHGDVAPTNILVSGGKLKAVIDFGGSGVGDPACDLTIAWTFFFGESRDAFRSTLALDGSMWARARGWALWKGLIVLAEHLGSDSVKAAAARHAINEVLSDYAIVDDQCDAPKP